MLLDKIVKHKLKEIKCQKVLTNPNSPKIRDFTAAIKKEDTINLIAEIKHFSPSHPSLFFKGPIEKIALDYQKAGVAAISVVTDEQFFGGSFENLLSVKKKVNIPVLCKDFIFDEIQIKKARAYGADAILLIARILEKEKFKKLHRFAVSLGLSCLVEVHDEKDLKKIMLPEVKIIGINNRNLDTLKIDLNIAARLRKLIPDNKFVVSESGIKNVRDIKKIRSFGINTFLIGENILSAPNRVKKIKEFRLA